MRQTMTKRVGFASMLALLLSALSTILVAAHPLGNFSVNRYSRLEIARDEIVLTYVLDLAEIPTLQELRAAGVQAGAVDPSAKQALLAAKANDLIKGARLTVGGEAVTWVVKAMSLDLQPGQAELETLRVSLRLAASVPLLEGARLEYRDTNYPGRAGWHEVVLQSGPGVTLAESTASSVDRSSELRSYPEEAERAPLDVSSVRFRVTWSELGEQAAANGAGPSAAALATSPWSERTTSRLALDPRADQLAALLRDGAGATPLTLTIALVVAAGLGALHAFEPGHGKTVVGSYLVGSRGTAKHAVLLGLTVTITHTLGVYALGLVTLVAAQYIVPERLYPILGMISGGLVVVIGLSLIWARLGALLRRPSRIGMARAYISHEPHDHGLPGHTHHHHQTHEHGHTHPIHDHAHPTHDHGHGMPQHTHGGGAPHSHSMPGQDGSPVTVRSLLALGVSGGLLPCPSALVVLLAAISLQNVALGMLLVAAFSVGLATVLTGIGLLALYGGGLIGRSSVGARFSGSPLFRAVPALGAVAITLAGLAIAVQAASTLL